MALAVDQWRDSRATEARARDAVAAITAELQANRAAAEHYKRGVKAGQKQLLGRIAYQRGRSTPGAWPKRRAQPERPPRPRRAVERGEAGGGGAARTARGGGEEIARDVYIDRGGAASKPAREGFAGFILLTTDFPLVRPS